MYDCMSSCHCNFQKSSHYNQFHFLPLKIIKSSNLKGTISDNYSLRQIFKSFRYEEKYVHCKIYLHFIKSFNVSLSIKYRHVNNSFRPIYLKCCCTNWTKYTKTSEDQDMNNLLRELLA